MILLTSESQLPSNALLIGSEWQDSNEFNSALSDVVDDCIAYGSTVFSLKRDHFDADGLFEQWSRDYYCL